MYAAFTFSVYMKPKLQHYEMHLARSSVNNLICTQIVELIDRYDAECVSANDKVGFIQDTKTDKACTRKITVSMSLECGFIYAT